jgi:hypothetical protein
MLRLLSSFPALGRASPHSYAGSHTVIVPSARLKPKGLQRKIKAIPNSIAFVLSKNYLVF